MLVDTIHTGLGEGYRSSGVYVSSLPTQETVDVSSQDYQGDGVHATSPKPRSGGDQDGSHGGILVSHWSNDAASSTAGGAAGATDNKWLWISGIVAVAVGIYAISKPKRKKKRKK